MIVIKQRFFIISITIFISIIGLFTIYFNVSLTPDKKLEKIIEQQEEAEVEHEEEDTEEEPQTDEQVEEVTEQVRLYFSDKLNQAIKFFFTTEVNIVALGDSLTEGVGDPTDQGGYIGILDQMINKEDEQLVHFSNYGKRGSRSEQLLTRLEDPDIERDIKQADILLITIGANDIMQIFKENLTKITLAPFTTEEIEYELRLQSLFSQLRQLNGNAHIYLLGFYNPFGQYFEQIEELDLIVNNWNDIGENVTEQYKKTTFIPMNDLFKGKTDLLLADDFFHPNYEGYYAMAERVLHYMIGEGDAQDEKEQ